MDIRAHLHRTISHESLFQRGEFSGRPSGLHFRHQAAEVFAAHFNRRQIPVFKSRVFVAEWCGLFRSREWSNIAVFYLLVTYECACRKSCFVTKCGPLIILAQPQVSDDIYLKQFVIELTRCS